MFCNRLSSSQCALFCVEWCTAEPRTSSLLCSAAAAVSVTIEPYKRTQFPYIHSSADIRTSNENSLQGWILAGIVMHPTAQESPCSVSLPQRIQPLSAPEIRLVGGGARRFLRLSFLLTYLVSFHCYPFIVIKFIGEKDGIILRHN